MKKISYLLVFIFLQMNLDAQIIDKLSVDIIIGRLSKETGLFDSEYYSNEFTYINGFNIGYNSSKKWQYYIGTRRLNSTIKSGDGFTYESSEVKGMEIKIGVKISPSSHKKVYLSYGLELFGEVSRQKGTYWVDYPPTYEINHLKYFVGIAPNLTINIKLVDRIVFFAETRFRFGRVNLVQKERTDTSKEIFPNREYWLKVYDPINSIGIKFEL